MGNSRKEHGEQQRALVAELYNKTGGNVSQIAKHMGLTRATVREHILKIGIKKPLFGGTLDGAKPEHIGLPPAGRVRRFLLTSAQNNTPLNEKMWKSLNTLAEHLGASIMVGTFTYNQNAYGELAVKRGTKKERMRELYYDPRLEPFIVDRKVELGNGLVWCGEMNILPTAVDPLSGLDTYAHRKSAIFPHAKLAMRSVAVMQGEWAKQLFTTGTVTIQNYIQKKEGLKAEHHHSYSALLVEVNDQGNWFVRQVHCATADGSMQDLDVIADGDKLSGGNRVEAITWGDLHATMIDEEVMRASLDMLDTLRPKFQFHHDVLEGASINRHQIKDKDPHYAFHRWLRGFHRVEAELEASRDVLAHYLRPWSKMYIPDSNHDGAWLKSWLAKYDYRVDPANSQLFLTMQSYMYDEIKAGKQPKDVNLLQWAMGYVGLPVTQGEVKFLNADESVLICKGKIECGMHGHLGPNGARGTPQNLNKVGRRANTGHTHVPGIYNGLYVAGTSSKLVWDYNHGPSGWNHAHIVTYPNGARSIVTLYKGMWRA